jgi:flagellar biosynthesis protein FlhF
VSLETFTGDAVAPLLRRAHELLGPDAQVLRLDHRAGVYTLVATKDAGFKAELNRKLREPVKASALPVAPIGRPLVVALVGPTGAGKTTAAAKLAMSQHAFGGKRVGLLGLDTYRVGAVEQLATWAEIARLPLTIVWTPKEASTALARMSGCDVVLVDTPGRGPAREDDLREVR